MASGFAVGLEIDRIDVNGNYEPGNCRWVTHQQQMQNTRKPGGKFTSRFKGVCWCARERRWLAHIKGDGKKRQIGRFTDEESAAKAYDAAAKQFYGVHAHVNFPACK